MMRVPMLVLSVIRPRVAAARAGGSGGAGSVMAVAAVAAETAVRLTLVQPAGRCDLVAVACRVIHRLRVLVLVVEAIGGLRVGVRVLAPYLRVHGSGVLVLQPVILGPVLRRVFVLVVRLARPLLVASALAGIMVKRAQHRHTLVRVLLDSEGLRRWHRWHEVR